MYDSGQKDLISRCVHLAPYNDPIAVHPIVSDAYATSNGYLASIQRFCLSYHEGCTCDEYLVTGILL